ncbi:MAG TPA: hypothetical protein VHW24_16945 [Bryobacteraceae bacterium]|nr:hypothetical protein [Bryobacteraceae bacterium]
MEVAREAALAAEARHLHRCLFHCAPDALTVERYANAHRCWWPNESPSPLLTRIVERNLDAEAVEFALRRRGHGEVLTRKLQIVCYLAESRAAYLHRFINFEASRARAWNALASATLLASWKLVKGEYAVRRHGLL